MDEWTDEQTDGRAAGWMHPRTHEAYCRSEHNVYIYIWVDIYVCMYIYIYIQTQRHQDLCALLALSIETSEKKVDFSGAACQGYAFS